VRGRLELYAADQASTVTIDGQPQPLESDPTAALAYQLESNPLYGLEIAAFLRAGAFGSMLPRDRAQDGHFTMQPYVRGKIPVVLVHGTASSPTRWAELVNELEGDPQIRDHFQIWIFMYDTGNPIGYSAGRLRAALTTAVHEFDPAGTDAALHRMVVIGHSQGGLLTKLTAIDTGTRLWDHWTKTPLDSLKIAPETRDLLRQSMFFTPLPFVGRVIFVSTPHRGALMAGGRLASIAASLVRMPAGILTQLAVAATSFDDDARIAALLHRPPTAVDNMSPSHPFVQITSSIPVPPQIPAHSIIAVKGHGPVEDGNDGVVAYRSAHIDEAASELVVRWNHSCQGQPEAIEEIRRILMEHAAAAAADKRCSRALVMAYWLPAPSELGGPPIVMVEAAEDGGFRDRSTNGRWFGRPNRNLLADALVRPRIVEVGVEPTGASIGVSDREVTQWSGQGGTSDAWASRRSRPISYAGQPTGRMTNPTEFRAGWLW